MKSSSGFIDINRIIKISFIPVVYPIYPPAPTVYASRSRTARRHVDSLPVDHWGPQLGVSTSATARGAGLGLGLLVDWLVLGSKHGISKMYKILM